MTLCEPEGPRWDFSRVDDAIGHVLLVEDNPHDALLMRNMLEAEAKDVSGVETVSRLEDACDRLNNRHYDLVLLALRLREGDAFHQAVSTITERCQAPVVIVTDEKDTGLGLDCLLLGVQEVLRKDMLSPESLKRAMVFSRQRFQMAQEWFEANTKALQNADEQELVAVSADLPQPDLPMLVVNEAGAIVSATDAAVAMMGWHDEDVIGRTLIEEMEQLRREGRAAAIMIVRMKDTLWNGEPAHVLRIDLDPATG